MPRLPVLVFPSVAWILVLAGLSSGSALGQPAKSAPELSTPARTVGAAKDELGLITDRRSVRGSIDASDPRLDDGSGYDLHEATFVRGQRVTIEMRSRQLDSYLLVFRRDGDRLIAIGENNNASPRTLDASISFTVTEPGVYVIVANGAAAHDRGTYDLIVAAEGGQQPPIAPQAHELEAAAPAARVYRGELDPAQDRRLADNSLFDIVVFQGRRGQRLELLLESPDFNPVLGVSFVGDDGVEALSQDDNSGPGASSLIRLDLPYTGRYAAVVNAFAQGEQGRYTLTVRELPDAQRAMPADDWTRRYPGGGDPNERYAVLVGIDDYPGERSDLASCVVDTREMRRVLIEHLGFRDENIVLINDEEATRDHIIEAITRHLGQAGPQGAAVFYYSGHGMQLDGNYGLEDNEPDGLDEAIYVWGESAGSSVVLDEEIGILMRRVRTSNRLVILDSCNSGTGTLGPSYKWVDMKDPWVSDRLEIPTKFVMSDAPTPRGGAHELYDGPQDHLLLAACASDQVATAGSGGRPSVFTYYLVREIDRNGPGQSFDDLIAAVRRAVDALRREAPSIVQVPQLEGMDTGRSLASFFGKDQ